MRQLFILLLTLSMAGNGFCENVSTPPLAIAQDANIEKRVKEIVSKMSLDDKVGQMCQINIDGVLTDHPIDGRAELDEAKMRNAFETFRIGSILNTPLGSAQDVDTWHRVISGIQEQSMKYQGIPIIYGVDQSHGTTYTSGGTLFPQEINMAAKSGARVCSNLCLRDACRFYSMGFQSSYGPQSQPCVEPHLGKFRRRPLYQWRNGCGNGQGLSRQRP